MIIRYVSIHSIPLAAIETNRMDIPEFECEQSKCFSDFASIYRNKQIHCHKVIELHEILILYLTHHIELKSHFLAVFVKKITHKLSNSIFCRNVEVPLKCLEIDELSVMELVSFIP